VSPTEAEGRTQKPPQGAQDPSPSKMDRWLARSKNKESSQAATPPAPSSEPSTTPGGSKLDRWLKRSQTGKEPEQDAQPEDVQSSGSKLDRWLARSKTENSASCPPAVSSGSQWSSDGVETDDEGSRKDQDEMMTRIRESFSAIDGALSHLQARRVEGKQLPQDKASRSRSAEDKARGQDSGPGMGFRVEEMGRGLVVTHVVPGGFGDQAGLQVKDVIKALNGRPVKGLKEFSQRVRDGGEVVCLDVTRGSGVFPKNLSIYPRTRPINTSEDDSGDAGSGEGEEGKDQDALLQKFLQARRNERDQERGGQGPKDPAMQRKTPDAKAKQFNKYGKDTKLWVPESEQLVVESMGSGDSSKPRTEIGGFFLFPPGHPDYVPLPPGEAALIAGRSDVHPSERLAPHWSKIIFTSPSGAEIRAQARHATYGTIEDVTGKLVNADPFTAHSDLNNVDAVSGSIAYIKRGGAPFTKKARVAVAAGAIACVVANTDRETFGMSYTDDGEPFEALNIPCVMISSDIAEKLESNAEWSVTLIPAKQEQQGSKQGGKAPQNPKSSSPVTESSSPPSQGPSPPKSATPLGLQPLETLPINPRLAPPTTASGLFDLAYTPSVKLMYLCGSGSNLGKPAKKPTMWKKIKLMLP